MMNIIKYAGNMVIKSAHYNYDACVVECIAL